MCRYIEDPDALMKSINLEKPLAGEKLDAIPGRVTAQSAAGCYCDSSSREHKWGLVLETIHYALVQKERESE
jgi:hypothetical protein